MELRTDGNKVTKTDLLRKASKLLERVARKGVNDIITPEDLTAMFRMSRRINLQLNRRSYARKKKNSKA